MGKTISCSNFSLVRSCCVMAFQSLTCHLHTRIRYHARRLLGGVGSDIARRRLLSYDSSSQARLYVFRFSRHPVCGEYCIYLNNYCTHQIRNMARTEGAELARKSKGAFTHTTLTPTFFFFVRASIMDEPCIAFFDSAKASAACSHTLFAPSLLQQLV